MEENLEQIIMSLIMYGGDARAKSLSALEAVRDKKFAEAKQLLDSANENINLAHSIQTGLIQSEIRHEINTVSLLMVHAQDHLMNAMTIRDLVTIILEIQEKENEG